MAVFGQKGGSRQAECSPVQPLAHQIHLSQMLSDSLRFAHPWNPRDCGIALMSGGRIYSPFSTARRRNISASSAASTVLAIRNARRAACRRGGRQTHHLLRSLSSLKLCYLLLATYHIPHATCHMLHATLTKFTETLLHATCYLPHTTCYMPHATCYAH